MPVAMERALLRIAKNKGFGKDRTRRFVFGSLRNTGWKPKRERKK